MTDSIKPPPEFDFATPSAWPHWKRRFERYLRCANVTKDEKKIDRLMYLMGDHADDILLTFDLSEDELKLYDTVMEKFDHHFMGKRNVIFERSMFNSRVQQENEPVDDFITELHRLVIHCDYHGLKEEMIRDRIVCGIQDRQLQQKLHLEKTLDLEKAVEMVRQWESVKKHQESMERGNLINTVNRVQASKRDMPQGQYASGWTCYNCGGSQKHSKEKCPARESDCKNCSKKGHWARVCKSKMQQKTNTDKTTVNLLTQEDAFLGAVTGIRTPSNSTPTQARWHQVVSVDNTEILFKLDPGADVTVIPYNVYKTNLSSQTLHTADRNLFGPARSELTTVGMFSSVLRYKTFFKESSVYVVQGLEQALLGRDDCESLNLVKRIENIVTTKVNVQQEFSELFQGLGSFAKEYTIKLRDGAKPFSLSQPRRVPIPLMSKLKAELDRMLRLKVIEPVDEPTEWCSPAVIVSKPNGDIRLCVDFVKLNESVEREHHPMPIVENTLAQMAGAVYYSKLDCKNGFWQIPLNPDSKRLTTFITPFGRYCFLRVPFGISSAPEHFNKRISEIITGLPCVTNHTDDILVWGTSMEAHDHNLRQLLKKLVAHKITLNAEKCIFGVTEVFFLGHKINSAGIHPDDTKLEAISKMQAPQTETELRSFLGLANYLGRFVPHLSTVAEPLNELLNKEFIWTERQSASFHSIVKLLVTPPVLAIYDVRKLTTVSADSSSYGLGAVLRQEQPDGTLRPVAYASRTLTKSEKNWAQIEKEGLACVWACDRFTDFLLGSHFRIETDHKPLLAVFKTKYLDELSPRLQRLRMRLMRYDFEIFHTPGKYLVAADVLSRQPLAHKSQEEFSMEVEAQVNMVMSGLPATDEKLEEILHAQQEDPSFITMRTYILNGWPPKTEIDRTITPYYEHRNDFSVQNGFLMRGCRLIIPTKLRRDILDRIHAGHMGITKCRARALTSVWWPGISTQIQQLIESCSTCAEFRQNRHEPLIPGDFPTRPWEQVALDLFHESAKWYLLITDIYSRFPEVALLPSLTATTVINHCKSIFSRHGVPTILRSDNGPQFDPVRTIAFREFARDWGFQHITSSPRFPQSNGFVESMVKVVKTSFKKNSDPYKALLEYRATPLANGYTPSQLLMSRQIRSTLPTAPENLQPHLVDKDTLLPREEGRRESQKKNYDDHHRVRARADLIPGERVWITDRKAWGVVKEATGTPRSYIVKTPEGDFRRNTFMLNRDNTALPMKDNGTSQASTPSSNVKAEEAILQIPNSEGTNYVTQRGRLTNLVNYKE